MGNAIVLLIQKAACLLLPAVIVIGLVMAGALIGAMATHDSAGMTNSARIK